MTAVAVSRLGRVRLVGLVAFAVWLVALQMWVDVFGWWEEGTGVFGMGAIVSAAVAVRPSLAYGRWK